MWSLEFYHAGVRRQPAFWASGGFATAEEALAEIAKRRNEKENIIKNIASLAFAYEGALDYEDLKHYPPYEIDILTKVMNDINDKREKIINRANKGSGSSSTSFDNTGISDTIGAG